MLTKEDETARVNLYNLLYAKGCFHNNIPEIITKGVSTITTSAPLKMKQLMVATELTVFISQLRKPLFKSDDKNGTVIPVNIISILLARSGEAKDSSMNAIRKSLEPAYEVIEQYRNEHAEETAKQKAMMSGKEPDDWPQFYDKPRDLFSSVGTVEGQMHHLAALESGKYAAGFLSVPELGSELQQSPALVENIKALSIGFDLGKIPPKLIKSEYTPPIKGLPYSALLFGTQDNILDDVAVKAKFMSEFNSKLARRCIINYNPQPVKNIDFGGDPVKLIEMKRALKTKAVAAQKILEPLMLEIVEKTTQEPLTLTAEVDDLFEYYLEYNNLESQTVSKMTPMSALATKHMQWKSLKLAGTFATLRQSPVV